jgi:multimeric flavodoxin WrbA
MNIVGIIASPRKQMNTDTVVQRILDGCQTSGARVTKIYLNDMKIQPCQSCKVQDGSGCIYQDDMIQICEIFENADGLVLGTPVYYNTVSSQMKLMIDRSYCLAKAVILPSGKRIYESSIKKKKNGIIVSVGGSGTNPECVLPVFNIWSPEINLVIVDSVLASRSHLGKQPMESVELLEEAFSKGENLVRSLRSQSTRSQR